MGKRTTSRRLAMQAMFEAEHAKISIDDALAHVFESDRFLDETKEFAQDLAVKTFNKKEELDQLIEKFLKDWKIDRLSGVDRNILRIAIHELQNRTVPESVVINEALNLAQKYSSADSVKFINGVLGAYLECGQKTA